jgi:hypothetical protein
MHGRALGLWTRSQQVVVQRGLVQPQIVSVWLVSGAWPPQESYTACDTTNNSEVQGLLYGHKTGGFHGARGAVQFCCRRPMQGATALPGNITAQSVCCS